MAKVYTDIHNSCTNFKHLSRLFIHASASYNYQIKQAEITHYHYTKLENSEHRDKILRL